VGPSDTDGEFKARGLSLAEVEQLKKDFIDGAIRAEKAGFGGF
jgi:2,4-dienoyl-CoA reductase-like NADH-dependent reductase (Old Yellow Enzyme family)